MQVSTVWNENKRRASAYLPAYRPPGTDRRFLVTSSNGMISQHWHADTASALEAHRSPSLGATGLARALPHNASRYSPTTACCDQ